MVAAVLTVLLLVVARRLGAAGPGSRCARGALVGVAGLVCLAVPLLALPVIPGATVDPGHEPGLSLFMVDRVGAAGRGAARRRPSRGRGHVDGGVAGTAGRGRPGGMWWAYHRDGGWPGVPGWDYGMQSPLFLTVQITGVLIGAAVLGWGLRASGLGDRLRAWYAPPAPSTATPQPSPARG